MPKLSEYAREIPRIQLLIKQGWRVFEVDMIERTIGLEKYIEVREASRGKTKIKRRRKVKHVRMRKEGFEWLEKISDALTFGYIDLIEPFVNYPKLKLGACSPRCAFTACFGCAHSRSSGLVRLV